MSVVFNFISCHLIKTGTSGKFKMASRMATNNNNCPLNQTNISNVHSVHNTLYFNTFVLIRISNAYREKIKYATISIEQSI